MFHRKIKPTITKKVATTLTLYDVNIDIRLVRKSYEATLYYSDEPQDRYSDIAIKEKTVITRNSPIELLEDIKEILTPVAPLTERIPNED